jgi:inorganic pyrophosphatase/manganese-dependent inorganic pyrophosphatase
VETETIKYIIVDVSDPEYIKDEVPLEQVVSVYDHHAGFEEYWQVRIGLGTHVEFIGAAATLIFREWKKAKLQEQMSRSTALLLVAAILDNTLNLTSANTTAEDVEAFHELCRKENIGQEWCAGYFSRVQKSVEEDLKNALFNDIKTIRDSDVLPPRVAQLCVWDACSILARLLEMRSWFGENDTGWMLNMIDLKEQCSYFVCDDAYYQVRIGKVFGVEFQSGVAKTTVPYLRKEIVKKTLGEKTW